MSLPVPPPERLYPLLPAVYRIADAELGHPLRALMKVLEGPYRTLEEDIGALYDDWFVETCAPWLVPYVGDLVGVRDTLDPMGVIPTVRARVANALAYARRKGPAWVLAQAARDVTGWPARAVEFRQELGQTQDLADVRRGMGRTADLRFGRSVEAGTPFDGWSRTVEVRGADASGRWAADRVGLSLWRLRSYPVTHAEPRPLGGGRFTLSPFGAAAPLYLPPRAEQPFETEPEPWTVPGPVSRELLERILEMRDDAFDPWTEGEYPVLTVWAGADEATSVPARLASADLSAWTLSPRALKPGEPLDALVDPELGRILFAGGAEPAWVRTDWSYGFSAELGGGPYARGVPEPAPGAGAFVAAVGGGPVRRGEVAAATVADAVDAWLAKSLPEGVVRLTDSALHAAPAEKVCLPAGRRLWIVAAPGQRPCLAGDLTVEGFSSSGLILDGLLVDGRVSLHGTVDLVAHHCTLRPPLPDAAGEVRRAVSASGDFAGRVDIQRSVTGPISVPWSAVGISLEDSIVAGGLYAVAWGESDTEAGAAPPLQVARCTLFGLVRAETVQAADSIFADPVFADDVSTGQLRCCYAPLTSRTPPRDRCQPARQDSPVQPFFTSTRFGDAAFAQLDTRCHVSIRTGASDGAEMGAFHLLDNPRREANLRSALREFLPNGMEPVISYIT